MGDFQCISEKNNELITRHTSVYWTYIVASQPSFNFFGGEVGVVTVLLSWGNQACPLSHCAPGWTPFPLGWAMWPARGSNDWFKDGYKWANENQRHKETVFKLLRCRLDAKKKKDVCKNLVSLRIGPVWECCCLRGGDMGRKTSL